MHEVVGVALGQGLDHRVIAAERHLVPADVRDEQGLALLVLVGEARHATGELAEAGGEAVLGAFVEEQLEAEADAEVGATAARDFLDRVGEPGRFELVHRVAERADAGQQHAVRVAHDRGIGSSRRA